MRLQFSQNSLGSASALVLGIVRLDTAPPHPPAQNWEKGSEYFEVPLPFLNAP